MTKGRDKLFEIEQSSRYQVFKITRVNCTLQKVTRHDFKTFNGSDVMGLMASVSTKKNYILNENINNWLLKTPKQISLQLSFKDFV